MVKASSSSPTPSPFHVVPKYFFLSFVLFTPLLFLLLFLLLSSSSLPPDIKIRPGYSSYDSYLQRQRQLNKTLNPKLRQIWRNRDWDR
ncbi:hypothetical protein MLD38_002357 [Melastoma candidum]|uniref:Uncharacterized protein n=1 Tax=Melastoma candidum TaxID=119954 RepID=A0ACB9S2U0_9MYRT|nr:hypothetical protein MLD38_002357 [Melastoma candidum]